MRDDVLICEISGKRPGTKKQRPTERYPVNLPHIIVSNDSEGYESEWPIVMVPDDYREWYISNIKTSDKAWYAPMNRSYAIKYAREHGYKYCVQLDDNIKSLALAYTIDEGDVIKRYGRYFSAAEVDEYIIDDMAEMLCTALDNTDAGMAGMNLSAVIPADDFMCERYVYTFFALKLAICPEVFQGDFEDDIEYKLKLVQMGVPTIQLPWMGYSKTAVGGGKDFKDVTGCRAAYKEAGILRGDHMRRLYGEIYSAGLANKGISTTSGKCENRFKHIIKPTKVGVKIYDSDAISNAALSLLQKYAKEASDQCKVKEVKAHGTAKS